MRDQKDYIVVSEGSANIDTPLIVFSGHLVAREDIKSGYWNPIKITRGSK